MRKPITPALHGALDYGFLGLMLGGPRAFGLGRRARALFATFGLVQGMLNAVTDQPLAVRHLVAFRTHGTVERNSLPLFVGLPLLTGILRDRRTLAFFLGAGATLLTVYNLTDWDAPAPGSAHPAADPDWLRAVAAERVAALPGKSALGRRDPAAGGGAEDPVRYAAEHAGLEGR